MSIKTDLSRSHPIRKAQATTESDAIDSQHVETRYWGWDGVHVPMPQAIASYRKQKLILMEGSGVQKVLDRECHEVCVSELGHTDFRYGNALKRSSNIMANWLRATKPFPNIAPSFLEVADRQVDQLCGGVLGREWSTCLD
jgi:hypothetical protein